MLVLVQVQAQVLAWEQVQVQVLAWEQVQEQMRKLVWLSLAAAHPKVLANAAEYELFGYDFMVDAGGKVWLIEANSAPDLTFSTRTTEQLVAQMMPEMAALVIAEKTADGLLGEPAYASKLTTCGRFSLIDRQKIPSNLYNWFRSSAEAMGVGASDDVAANAPAVVIPKSKEAEASIAAAAKNCILFAGLGPAEFRTVVDAMFEVKATAGQTLIAEGEKGDNEN